MRRLDHRQKGWLPRQLSAPRSFYCWRQDAPGLPPVPYELPLLSLGSSVLKPAPALEQSPYLLWTPWRGAAWLGWLEVDGGAIYWGASQQITYDTLLQWSPQLNPPRDESDLVDLASQVLRTLAAERLSPDSSAKAGPS